jgi:hypothetical protein
MPASTPGDRRPVLLVDAPIEVLADLNEWFATVFGALEKIDATQVPRRLVELGDALEELIERPRFVLGGQVVQAEAAHADNADLQIEIGRQPRPFRPRSAD